MYLPYSTVGVEGRNATNRAQLREKQVQYQWKGAQLKNNLEMIGIILIETALNGCNLQRYFVTLHYIMMRLCHSPVWKAHASFPASYQKMAPIVSNRLYTELIHLPHWGRLN